MIDILVDSGKTTGGIMLIIGAATLFSYVCTVFGIAQAAQALLLEISGNKYIFLLIVNVIFLIAGCFVDANSAMYIFIPIMYPVATQLGIDPVHFGVIATVNLAIGQVTPPVGVNLFVAIGVSEEASGPAGQDQGHHCLYVQGCVAPDCGVHYCAAAHHLCALVLYRALVR